MKNLGTMDRLLRVILAEICILVAFFWVAEEWQIPLYLIAAVMLSPGGHGHLRHQYNAGLEQLRDRQAAGIRI